MDSQALSSHLPSNRQETDPDSFHLDVDLPDIEVISHLKEGQRFSLSFEDRERILNSLLADVTLRNAFMAFLSKEHCEELLLFLEAVAICEAKEENQWAAEATLIYHRFIQPGSRQEVELPSHTRKSLENFFDSISPSKVVGIFADAKLFVEQNLISGEMMKFLKSPWYHKIINFKADQTVIEKRSASQKITSTQLHAGASYQHYLRDWQKEDLLGAFSRLASISRLEVESD